MAHIGSRCYIRTHCRHASSASTGCIERLGAGGMGEVYLAEHVLCAAIQRIKLIRPDRAGDVQTPSAVGGEVKVTATLTHPNTVQVYDYGHAEDGTFYYVMEHLPGLTLEQLVEQYGPLPANRAIINSSAGMRRPAGSSRDRPDSSRHQTGQRHSTAQDGGTTRSSCSISAWSFRSRGVPGSERLSRTRGPSPARRLTCRRNRRAGRTNPTPAATCTALSLGLLSTDWPVAVAQDGRASSCSPPICMKRRRPRRATDWTCQPELEAVILSALARTLPSAIRIFGAWNWPWRSVIPGPLERGKRRRVVAGPSAGIRPD